MHECSNHLKKQVGNSLEPYRDYLRPIRNKLISTQKEIELFLNEKKLLNEAKLVQSINEIVEPLTNVYNSLCAIKCKAIADGSVLDLLRRAFSFGMNSIKATDHKTINHINHRFCGSLIVTPGFKSINTFLHNHFGDFFTFF